MTPHRILIVYGTSYGHTAKIAARVGAVLGADGLAVTTYDAATLPAGLDPASFDGVVVAASIVRGKHQAAVEQFIARNIETLNRAPSAFLSVSGSAASPDLAAQNDARVLMERFVEGLTWHPDLMATLGGAIQYTRYPWLLRWIMKRITTRAGGPGDTTRDHDLTNWAHVEELAHRFARLVEPLRRAAPDPLSVTA